MVEAAGKIRVRVGNAGGLAVSLNGKPLGEIGPRGQIRTVELTSAGSEILTPPPPKAESQEEEETTEPAPPPKRPSVVTPANVPASSEQRLQN
jgi:hypothetical protein